MFLNTATAVENPTLTQEKKNLCGKAEQSLVDILNTDWPFREISVYLNCTV